MFSLLKFSGRVRARTKVYLEQVVRWMTEPVGQDESGEAEYYKTERTSSELVKWM